jgi:hypothetical protein
LKKPACPVPVLNNPEFSLAVIVDGLAELHIRWPAVSIVFCETRGLAEEWTYRYLAAAQAWAITEHPALQHISPGNPVEFNRPRWGTRRAGTRHRRGPRPGPGPRHRPGRARPRPTPTRNPASLARRTPHHLKPNHRTHTQTTFARNSSSASKSPRPQLKIRLQTGCLEKIEEQTFRGGSATIATSAES